MPKYPSVHKTPKAEKEACKEKYPLGLHISNNKLIYIFSSAVEEGDNHFMKFYWRERKYKYWDLVDNRVYESNNALFACDQNKPIPVRNKLAIRNAERLLETKAKSELTTLSYLNSLTDALRRDD